MFTSISSMQFVMNILKVNETFFFHLAVFHNDTILVIQFKYFCCFYISSQDDGVKTV